MTCNNFFFVFITVLFTLFLIITANDDEIKDLPGLSQPINFKQYSGYLDITEGKHYFYWFVESQKDPENAPVVLWLNGGPGCSSLFGNLGENGPFRVNSDGKTLVLNPHSWNTVANVIYLESPAGTGFSYKDDGVYNNTDKSTAEDNHLVLEEFFKKYPNYKKNPFYITGESYAGVYIPMLAQQIFNTKSAIKLKGVAIGNGLLTGTIFDQSNYDFALAHGLLTTDSYEKLIENCCECKTGRVLHECDFTNPFNASKCQSVGVETVSTPNSYNIYDDCDASAPYQRIFDKYYAKTHRKYGFNVKSNRNAHYRCPHNGYIDYLNLPEVRSAIHVRRDAGHWDDCGGPYSDWGTKQHDNTIQLINEYKLQRFVVYNGDFDTVCNFVGDQRFVDGLGFKKSGHYSQWTIGGKPDGIIGGFVQKYEKGVSFVLVRGAGHMVPHDKPEAALQLLKNVIGITQF